MATKIFKCTCEHKAQDEIHGKDNRVCNKLANDGKTTPKYRCTVCLKINE